MEHDPKVIVYRNKNAENEQNNDILSQTSKQWLLEPYMFKLHTLTIDAVVEALNALFYNTLAHNVIDFDVLKSLVNVHFQVLQIVWFTSEGVVLHDTPEVKIHKCEVGKMCGPVYISFVLVGGQPKHSLPHLLCHTLCSLLFMCYCRYVSYVT